MNNKKTIFSVVGAVAAGFAILGGLWAFEDRYAKSVEITELEVQVVQSLQEYNVQQQKAINVIQLKQDYRFYQFLYDKLGNDLLEIRRILRREPTDAILRQDYIDVQEQRNKVKAKMDEIMRKIQ